MAQYLIFIKTNEYKEGQLNLVIPGIIINHFNKNDKFKFTFLKEKKLNVVKVINQKAFNYNFSK